MLQLPDNISRPVRGLSGPPGPLHVRLWSLGLPTLLVSQHAIWISFCALAGVVVLLCLAPVAHAQDTQPAASDVSTPQVPKVDDNAALQYWQAFAAMTQIGDDQRSWLSEPAKASLDSKVDRYLNDNANALRFLYRGSQKPRCDWGIDYTLDGPGTLMPHLPKSKELARLACLRARMDFSKGRYDFWVTNLVSSLKLSRDLSQGPLISRLVGSSVQSSTIDAALADIPNADKATLLSLATKIDTLPPMASLTRNMNYENAAWTLWMHSKLEAIRKLVGSDPKEARQSTIELEHDIDGLGSPGVRPELDPDDTPTKVDHLLAQVHAASRLWDQAVTLIDQPVERSIPQLETFEKGKENWPQFARIFMPGLKSLRLAIARSDTQFAMFRAGIAVALDGKDALAKYPDPSTGKPFDYTPRGDHSFELSSQFVGFGQPVRYTFGK